MENPFLVTFLLTKDIDVKFSSAKGFSMRENRPTSSVGEFVNSKINWKQIEDQLVIKETGNRYFAHVFCFLLRLEKFKSEL